MAQRVEFQLVEGGSVLVEVTQHSTGPVARGYPRTTGELVGLLLLN